jgi:hypothetical protein
MRTAIKKKKAKAKRVFKKKAVKYSDLPDLSNDPYFVKKGEEAMEMLRESGLIRED